MLLAAFLFFASALPKFAGRTDAVTTFTEFGWGQWLRYVPGTVEAAGAIGLVGGAVLTRPLRWRRSRCGARCPSCCRRVRRGRLGPPRRVPPGAAVGDAVPDTRPSTLIIGARDGRKNARHAVDFAKEAGEPAQDGYRSR
ncbi:hypothetical protein D0T12_16770 [Actinomadura spongiicola]|uniref:Uncharacterized protein n=1 Tax=Actinomadura spongiicola TaxID=2303421 RepID=A0A372GER0_9ACTN|nr:DoxX family protein [Actinomadura spongiicola]RFS83864.1 hypothetical protein D0T12_16770 [Actinomadura spongiicola]